MKKTILMASVLILTLASIGYAGSRGFGPGMKRGGMLIPPGKWWELPKLSESLTLTQEEKEKLENLHFEHRRQMIDLRSEVQKAQLELEQLMRSDAFNTEAGIQGFKRLQDARSTLTGERFKYVLVVRDMLGTDRYRKLNAEVRKFWMKARGDRRPGAKGRMAYLQRTNEN